MAYTFEANVIVDLGPSGGHTRDGVPLRLYGRRDVAGEGEWYFVEAVNRDALEPMEGQSMANTGIVRAVDSPQHRILEYVHKGAVETDLALEDVAEARERWQCGTGRDARVVDALDAIIDGRQLVDINKVIAKGGTGTNAYFPALALAPARWPAVRARITSQGVLTYFRASRDPYWFATLPRTGWKRDFPWKSEIGNVHWRQRAATMPFMPPEVRSQVAKGDLVLWEADWGIEQARTKIDWDAMMAHLDPALLEPVVGSLYIVKTTWDLTELEVAALR